MKKKKQTEVKISKNNHNNINSLAEILKAIHFLLDKLQHRLDLIIRINQKSNPGLKCSLKKEVKNGGDKTT